jgi:hypothetical protein
MVSRLPVIIRTSPATIGNPDEESIQPIRNKEKVKSIFWWVKKRALYGGT